MTEDGEMTDGEGVIAEEGVVIKFDIGTDVRAEGVARRSEGGGALRRRSEGGSHRVETAGGGRSRGDSIVKIDEGREKERSMDSRGGRKSEGSARGGKLLSAKRGAGKSARTDKSGRSDGDMGSRQGLDMTSAQGQTSTSFSSYGNISQEGLVVWHCLRFLLHINSIYLYNCLCMDGRFDISFRCDLFYFGINGDFLFLFPLEIKI